MLQNILTLMKDVFFFPVTGGWNMVEPVLIAQGRCLQAPRREVHAELGGWGST